MDVATAYAEALATERKIEERRRQRLLEDGNLLAPMRKAFMELARLNADFRWEEAEPLIFDDSRAGLRCRFNGDGFMDYMASTIIRPAGNGAFRGVRMGCILSPDIEFKNADEVIQWAVDNAAMTAATKSGT